MQPLLTELESLVTKTESKNVSMVLPKIIETICNLINYLSNSSKAEITQNVKALQQLLNSTLLFNFGESTNEYLIARIIASLFVKVMAACESNQNQVLLTNLFNILLSSKPKMNTKLITVATLNGILRNNKEVPNFPRGILQEMFQNLQKVCKNNHEISIRLGTINCMRLLIKMKLALSTANTQEIMKLLLRYIAEKTEELKLCCARTLLSFLNHSPWSDSLQYYEQICSLCLRIIGDNVAPDLKRQLTFCFTKVNIMKLIRGLDVQDKSKKQTKGAPVATESTDKVTDLIHSFSSMYIKEENLRYFLLEYLFLALTYFKREVRANHLNSILNTIWNLFKKLSPDSAPKNEKFFSKFMENFTVLLTQDLKFAFLSQVAETCKVKASQKVADEEDSMKANATLIKNNPTRAYQFQFLLKLFIHLVESLGSLLREKFQSPNNLFDALIPYLSFDHIEIQICAAYALNYLVDAYPRGRAQIISRLLHLMTVARGELAASQVDMNNKDALVDPTFHFSTVRGSSFAMSLLVQNIDFEFKSIPFDIINSVFESAKSILTDEVEDSSIKKILYDNAGYVSLGWIIIGELTSLEYHWVGSRIKILFDLWKNLFMTEEIQATSEGEYKKKLFERIHSFKSLRKFSSNCKKLQNEAILKVIGTFICNFTSLLLSQIQKNPFNISIKKTDSEIISAKLEVYKCVNLINPAYYSNKFNLILQTAIEDVANFLNEEIYFITKKLFPYIEYDIAYLLDFGPKFFKILYGLEDIYDFDNRERTLFDYDFSQNFFSKYLSNSRTELVKEQLTFIGDAFNSPVFIQKNKTQLLKFLISNIKACHTAKDPFIRIQKLFSLLIITLSIVSKISNELPKDQELDMETLEIFKEICENSWSYVNNHARITCALIYAMLFKLSKSKEFHENLMKTLYDGLNDPVKSPTISVVVGCVFRFYSQMDQKLFIQLVNIFQKSSRNQDGTNAIWLINSLRLSLEHAPDYSRDLIKACLPFLMRYHYENKNSGRVSFTAWCYLIEILTKRITSLNIERMYHMDALIIDLDNTDFVIPDTFLKDAKLTLTSAILNNPQLNIKSIGRFLKLKYTRNLVKMLKNPRLAGKLSRLPEKAFDLTQLIVEKGDAEEINLYDKKFNQIYLNAINSACNKRDAKIEKIEKLYYKFISVQLQLLKLKLSSFEDQLLFFKDYVFPEQETKDDEAKEPEKPSANINSGKIEFNYDFSVALKTRVYALKCIENLLQYTNVQNFKAKDVINFASLIIPFVFKVASSLFEETKEMGMKIFHHVFSKLIDYSETGEDLNTMIEGEKVPLMLQYGAQIDALIRFNLKDINENSAASVQSSLKLYNKFFKLMYRDDVYMVKKLFTLVASGIQKPLKLSQSTYHSERALTEIHFTRVRILCKVYQYFKENLDKEATLRDEFDNFFSKTLKKFLEQNLVAILEDSALVVMFSRRLLKSYENFHFIYNGTKLSYDSKSILSSLPVFLSTYFTLVHENIDVDELIYSAPDEETKKYLRNNVKAIPPKDTSIHICLILCNYFLTHNDTYENNSEGIKRFKKLFDYQLYRLFKEKVMVLKGLQTILLQKNIVEENFDIFSETLNILNNYLMMGVSPLTNEIFRVYQATIVGHFDLEIFEIISTSLSSFYYFFQIDAQTDPDGWAETINLFFNLLSLLITHLIEGAADANNHQQASSYLSFFLNMPLTYLFSGVPRLQAEALRALKQICQAIMVTSQGSDKKKALVEMCFQKFLFMILNKLNDVSIPQDTRIRLIDLLIAIEQMFKDSFKGLAGIFEEGTLVICRDSDLLRVYLLSLRTIWRATKQITQESIPKVITLIKHSFDNMQAHKPISNQDNELIAEVLKVFIYLHFESPMVNKNVFAEALLGFVLIALELGVNVAVGTVITQLMQHLYSNIPAPQVKGMLNSVSNEQKAVLCKTIPILQTIDAQNFNAQQTNVAENTGQSTAEKPTIKLKAFGKKN